MKKSLLIRMSVLAFILIQAMASQSQHVLVRGNIKSGQSALPQATVSLGNHSTVTDHSGEFSIYALPGDYLLVISHTGFRMLEQQIRIDSTPVSLNLNLTGNDQLGEVVVTGFRSLIQRSNLNTAVPVDVLTRDNLVQSGQMSLTQMLQFTAPSLNASRPLVNEPVSLRGLDPDQVLILVNGKRYHPSAYLNHGAVRGMLGRGSAINDLNSVPLSAIERIEVLRDGAAAQYGSDAIAGVINIILRKNTNLTSVNLQTGQFYKGDGESIRMGFHHGLHNHAKGYLNLSADIRYLGPTFRGGEYYGPVYVSNRAVDDSIIKSRKFDRKSASNAGSGKQAVMGILVNGGQTLKKNLELFWTASANLRRTVFISTLTFPRDAQRINPELHPDGFKALPWHWSLDYFFLAGIKGITKNSWNWEWSSTMSGNQDRYHVKNANNATQYFTLGKNAPTSFYTGTLVYDLSTHTFQATKNFPAGKRITHNLAFGAEWRREHFEIKEGEEAAWKNYDTANRKQGGTTGLVFSPVDVISKIRNVAALFLDLESEFDRRLLIELAGRYEYYGDFGNNLAGKMAARYKFCEAFSVRGSVSNGFRAPGLQQRFYNFTQRAYTGTGGTPIPVVTGIFRNDSEVAMAFGIPGLQAEKSTNLSGGIVTRIGKKISVTVDAYWIRIRNRIVLSGVFDRRNREVDSLLGSLEVNRIQFFANAINTRTAGVDIVTTGNWNIRKATLRVTLAANFTQNRIFGTIRPAGNLSPDSLNSNSLFGRTERTRMEKGQPADKVLLAIDYQIGKVGIQIRNSRFGKTSFASASAPENPLLDEHLSPKILTDLLINYTPWRWLRLTAGGLNLFDIYPDKIKHPENTGQGLFIYNQETTSFGFNGGFYYINMEFSL